MALITFTDKVTLAALPDVAEVNKLTAAEVNHIKSVVNANAAIVEAALLALKWKAPVKVATTANGTLASAFANGQTVDGVSLVTGDRILLKNQSDQTVNGIYTVNASGAPTRATDADSAPELEGAAVLVQQGTANANTSWQQTTDGITLGSSNIVWATLGTGLPTAAQVAFTPAGNLSATDVQAALAELDSEKVSTVTGTAVDNTDPANPVINIPVPSVGTYRTLTATHTIDATDLVSVNAGDQLTIRMNAALPTDLEIPTNATQAFPVGSIIGWSQAGAGQVTIVPLSGVTLRSPNSANKSFAQYSRGFIEKIAANEWLLSGDITV